MKTRMLLFLLLSGTSVLHAMDLDALMNKLCPKGCEDNLRAMQQRKPFCVHMYDPIHCSSNCGNHSAAIIIGLLWEKKGRLGLALNWYGSSEYATAPQGEAENPELYKIATAAVKRVEAIQKAKKAGEY